MKGKASKETKQLNRPMHLLYISIHREWGDRERERSPERWVREGEREMQSQVEGRLNEIEMERLVYSQCVRGEYRSLIGGKTVFLVEGRRCTYADA